MRNENMSYANGHRTLNGAWNAETDTITEPTPARIAVTERHGLDETRRSMLEKTLSRGEKILEFKPAEEPYNPDTDWVTTEQHDKDMGYTANSPA